MNKMKVLLFVGVCFLFLSLLFMVLKKEKADEKYFTNNINYIVDVLFTVGQIENANYKAAIELPNSIEQQKEIYMIVMDYLMKNKEIWEVSGIGSVTVCQLLYIDSYFGKEYQEWLVEKLSDYVSDEGLINDYETGVEQISKEQTLEMVQNTAYMVSILHEVLDYEELQRFKFEETIMYFFNKYLPEASIMDGDKKDNLVSSMRGMYSEILCLMNVLKTHNKLNFKLVQDLQQQRSRRNFEERYRENTLYNATMWNVIAMEEQVYNNSDKYDAYANQMFCKLTSKEDFYIEGNSNPLIELRFYISKKGDVSGNEFYKKNINGWLDGEIEKIYDQIEK